jgi:PAS domain S-box-containing protein
MREQLQREQALRDGEARIKAILGNAVDGIITINERGVMEEVNPAACTIFGYEPGEMLGQTVNMLMPAPYRREHDSYMRAYRHTGQGKIIGIGRETKGLRKDGTIIPIDLSVSEVSLSGRRLYTGLIRDISGRKQTEEHRALLVAELSHRVKNTLATVISIARQTFPREEPFIGAIEAFDGRIRALAHTHSRLAEHSWTEVSLADVIAGEVSPYFNQAAANIQTSGPDVMLKPKTAISLGMALHELVTNAAKHGALSVDGGSLEIAWDWIRPAGKQLRIRWSERGGPEVGPPARSGFGRLLLERGLAHELRGKVQLDFAREGLKCTIVFPLDSGSAEDDDGSADGI